MTAQPVPPVIPGSSSGHRREGKPGAGGPGRALISWTPCICPAAKEASARGRGNGASAGRLPRVRGAGAEDRPYEPPHDSAQPHARLSVVNGA
jgi:hypothetical protein